MSEEIKDTLIECEKEPEIKFSVLFKLILAISICLTGLVTLIGIVFFISGVTYKMWSTDEITILLYNSIQGAIIISKSIVKIFFILLS